MQQEPEIGVLEEWLADADKRVDAARALEARYEAEGDWEGLRRVLEILAEAEEEAEKRAAHLRRSAKIAADRLESPILAFGSQARALRELPDDRSIRREIIGIARSADCLEELAELFIELGEDAKEPAKRIEWWKEAASVAGDDDLQRSCWQKVLDEAPDDEEAFHFFEAHYGERGDLPALVRLLETRAEVEARRDVRQELLLQAAALLAEKLDDRGAAIELCVRWLDKERDPVLVDRLAGFLEEERRFDELEALLRQGIEEAEAQGKASEALDGWVRVAELRLRSFDDTAAAAEIFGRVLARSGRHPLAIEALEATLRREDPASRALAARLLAPIHEQEKNHGRWVELLEVLATDSESDAEKRKSLLRIAELRLGPLKQPELAFTAAARALHLDPDDEESLGQVVAAAEAAELEEELSDLLRDCIDEAATNEGKLRLLRTLGARLEAQGEIGEALEAFRQARARAPGDREILDTIVRLAARAGDDAAYLDALRSRLAQATDDDERKEWLARIAEAQEERLGDPDAALATLRRLLDLDPDDVEILDRIAALCRSLEKWSELSAALERRIDKGEALDAMVELAQLRQERLLDRDGAVDLYEEVLRKAPGDARAIEALEALFDDDPAFFRVGQLLEAHYRSRDDFFQLAELLDARIAAAMDPRERGALLRELAELRIRQGREDLAFYALSRAFREEPGDEALWKRLGALARGADALEEWRKIADEAFAEMEPEAASAFARQLAIEEEARGNPAEAMRWWERLRALSGGEADERMQDYRVEALRALERHYRSEGRWDALAGVLEALAEGAEPQERVRFLSGVAQISTEKLEDPGRAAEAWEAVRLVDPDHPAALRNLARLYEELEAFDSLHEVLLQQKERAEGAAAERLLLRLAELAQSRLGDVDRAIAHYRELLERNPSHEIAFERLLGHLEDQGRDAELAEALQGRIERSTSFATRKALLERLAAVQRDRLGDHDGAIRSYRTLLEGDPHHLPSLEALRALYERSGDEAALAETLEALAPLQPGSDEVKAVRLDLGELQLRRGLIPAAVEQGRRVLDLAPLSRGELDRLRALFTEADAVAERVRTLELLAALAPEAESVALLGEIARIWEEQGRKERAAPALEGILARRPGDEEAFETLRGLYRASGDFRKIAQLTERFLPHCPGDEQKIDLLRELAGLYERQLGQKEIALARLGSALELAPTNRELLDELMRLADSAKLHEELALILEAVAGDRDDVAHLWFARAQILDRPLDRGDEAEESFQAALSLDPTNTAIWIAREEALGRRGRHAERVAVLEQMAGLASSLEERQALLLRVASLYADELQRVDEGIASLERAFELQPDEEVFLALSSLLRRARRWEPLASLLSRSVEAAAEKEERLELLDQLALLYENDIGDLERAAAVYERLLEIDPSRSGALDALERIYTGLQRHPDLLTVYDRKIAAGGDAAEVARLHAKAASLWDEKLDNPSQAVAHLEAGLRVAPSDLGLLRELSRLLHRLEDWQRLAALHEHRLQSAEGAESVEAWLDLAELAETKLGDTGRAIEAFERALRLDPASPRALQGLLRLHEASGDWESALRYADRLLAGAVGARAVEMHAARGRLLLGGVGDREQALAAFERALALEPTHLASLRAVAALHREAGDRKALAAALSRLAGSTGDAEEKGRLHLELGLLHREAGETRQARHAFEESLRHGPGGREAADHLSELYLAEEAWGRAEPLLERLVADPGDTPTDLRVAHAYRLGLVKEKLDKRPEALEAYRNAYELDPTHLPSAEALAHLLAVDGDYVQSLRVHQSILLHHQGNLSEPELVHLHYSIGDLRRRIGDEASAQESLQRALALDPWHPDSLRLAAEIAEEAGDGPAALQHLEQLLQVLEGQEKAELLQHVAILADEKLGDLPKAITFWGELSSLRPTDLGVLERLASAHRRAGQETKALEILERLVVSPSLAKDPARGASAHRQLAEAHAEGRGAEDWLAKAFHHANASLDLDWRQPELFSKLEQLLVAERSWPELEAAYLKMIERLSPQEHTEQARATLYRTLGELYHEVLEKPHAAAQAFRAVLALQPDDKEVLERYVTLATEQRGSEDAAVEAWRRFLALGADPGPAATALVKLHGRRRAHDEAFVAAQVAAHLLGSEGPDEAGLLRRLRPFARGTASGSLDDTQWKELLFHEQLREPAAALLALLEKEAAQLFAHSLERVSVAGRSVSIDRRKDRIPLAGSDLFFVEAYRYVARVLGVEAPDLYRCEGIDGVVVAPTAPLSILVAPRLLEDGASRRELFFRIGFALSHVRAELGFSVRGTKKQLEQLVAAALALGEPRFQPEADAEVVGRLKERLAGALSPEGRSALAVLAKESVGKRLSLRRYLEGAAHTSRRVGALLAGDLQVVASLLDAPPADRDELAAFCLSEDYAQLRRELGLAIHIS